MILVHSAWNSLRCLIPALKFNNYVPDVMYLYCANESIAWRACILVVLHTSLLAFYGSGPSWRSTLVL